MIPHPTDAPTQLRYPALPPPTSRYGSERYPDSYPATQNRYNSGRVQQHEYQSEYEHSGLAYPRYQPVRKFHSLSTKNDKYNSKEVPNEYNTLPINMSDNFNGSRKAKSQKTNNMTDVESGTAPTTEDSMQNDEAPYWQQRPAASYDLHSDKQYDLYSRRYDNAHRQQNGPTRVRVASGGGGGISYTIKGRQRGGGGSGSPSHHITQPPTTLVQQRQAVKVRHIAKLGL